MTAANRSADRLRLAATKLRESAEAATPGDKWSLGNPRFGESPTAIRIAYMTSVTAVGHVGTEANAQFIALMSPPVALALADWLDDIQVLWASAESMADADGDPLTFGESIDSHALKLADAILGDQP